MRRSRPCCLNFVCVVVGMAVLLCVGSPGSALTSILEVTPEYLRVHAKELSLKVDRRADGMLAFTITRTVPEQRFYNARLSVKQNGKTLANTYFSSHGQKEANSFSFAISPETLAESELTLDEAPAARSRSRVGYQFRLRDHVPEELAKQLPLK